MIASRYSPCKPKPDESETLRQFCLDAPRIDVTVDALKWNPLQDGPNLLFDKLELALNSRKMALLCAEFCTQTVLAPYFSQIKEKLMHSMPQTHFVDGGRQNVGIDTRRGLLRVEKPFKIVDFDSVLDARVLFVVVLKLDVDLATKIVSPTFTQTEVVESDWIIVDSEQNDAVFRDMTKDIADSIAANRTTLTEHESAEA